MTKISIITVVYNNSQTINYAIESVLAQDYPDIEYIIIDGASTDGTVEIIKSYRDRIAKFISEPDKGIYDAMNKGLKLATGDIIGILNSDDFYPTNTVISDIVREFETKDVEMVFGDLVFVKPDDLNKVVRSYSTPDFTPNKFAWGWMPPHPTCYLKRSVYERYGDFKTDYRIAADYEILTRFMAKHQITYSHIPKILIKMRTGGVSTRNFKSNWILNREIVRGCAENGIQTNMLKVCSKYFAKIFQLIPSAKPSTPN
jgi:glycosyltransferase involved in cell wall biosynthesis